LVDIVFPVLPHRLGGPLRTDLIFLRKALFGGCDQGLKSRYGGICGSPDHGP
jgi:hypothetical protein